MKPYATAVGNKLTRFIGGVVKDVATGPALYDWIAHGANELANVIVKGQTAPIYARSYGPRTKPGGVHGPADAANPEETVTVNPAERATDASDSLAEPAAETGIVDSFVQQAHELAAEPEQEMEIER